jgi:hypothetical protein
MKKPRLILRFRRLDRQSRSKIIGCYRRSSERFAERLFCVMNKRLAAAMAAYAVLIALAFYLLRGKALYAVLILFGALVAKTLIAAKAGW